MPTPDALILAAAAFARAAHAGQRRKYHGTPYIRHPERVAGRAAALPGATAEMVAAAYLHDVVEDCPVSPADIAREFGPVVAQLVHELTKASLHRDGPREARLAVDHAFLATISPAAKRLKLLDRIDNLQDMAGARPARIRDYALESRAVAAAVGDADADLCAELLALVALQLAATATD